MINIYNRNNHDENKPLDLAAKNKVGSKKNFTAYQDPTNEFTSDELKWGFWYVRHKALLYKITVIVLLVINAGLVGFGLWKWGVYLLGISDQQKLERNLAASVNYTGIHARIAAQPIQVINTQLLASRENKYDVVAELINPNERFLVTFDYYFVTGGIKTPVQKSFLLPRESRLAAALGITDGAGGNPAIVLENIKYQRISNHEISDIAAWQTERLNFQVTDFVFLKSLAQEGNNADGIQFKLTNASPYSFVNANFYVALLQNGQIAGILPLHLDRINSLETKDIDVRSFVPNLQISEITIFPIINIYDESVYAPGLTPTNG